MSRRTGGRTIFADAGEPAEEAAMPDTTTHHSPPDTIVLIHGLWLTALSWEHWITRYTALGYRVLAWSWPGMDGSIEQLRRDPSGITGLGVGEIVDYYEREIRALDRPPIIIGHSFGGLITQILLDRGLGAAGVAIDPAPVKGIFLLPFSELRAALPALKNPFDAHGASMLSLDQFHYGFTNHLTLEESRPVYERYAVPGPSHILFQASLANFNPRAATTVNFANGERAPLLLVAGGRDHTVPASVTRANFALFAQSPAVTAFREYRDRTHWTIGQSGWEEVADFALEWATEHAAGAGVATAAKA
jgi:pimeloyl-ACP methyl ester carboxylesterase